MKTVRHFHSELLHLGVVLSFTCMPAAHSQSATSQGASAQALLSQLSAAFSGNRVIQQVQLSGSAIWYAGDSEDSGSATLTASTNGSLQVQLSLGSMGLRTEMATGSGLGASCQWTGADGTVHGIDSGNCLKPMAWFMPALSLQPSLVPNYLGAVDLGSGTVGDSATAYRHLQSQLVFGGVSGGTTAAIMQLSTTDLGLDPVSLLPAVLAYSAHPDSGAPTSIAIEIHYSDYRSVEGVQIPFHIQRYVNGALQLDIAVNSAEIN